MTRKEFNRLSLDEVCQKLEEEGQTITSYETLKDFAKKQIDDDNFFLAQHICEALYDDQAEYYIYDYSMGTLETPTPITRKDDIADMVEDDLYYQTRKDQVREEARAWQLEASEKSLSWGEIAEKSDYFYKLGKRYGLVREFKENGII